MNRRDFLLGSAGVAALLTVGAGPIHPNTAWAVEAEGLESVSFSFDWLTKKMKDKAAGKGAAEDAPAIPEWLSRLSYDQHRAIRFNPENALWSGAPHNYELQAFHPGWLFNEPLRLYEAEGEKLTALTFTEDDFIYGAGVPEHPKAESRLPGIAGFRLHYPLNSKEYKDELVAFLGASYFRALGKGSRYGLSARGLAVNTVTGDAEEFPRFTAFYVAPPAVAGEPLTVYAEMESDSVFGAYEFKIVPGDATLMDVRARLFVVKDTERFGIAPLTSMYLFGEGDSFGFDDYRPEVHDSDGLFIHASHGQEIWRPLANPKHIQTSFFSMETPKGFGLMQRDRRFDNYQDLEARYELRPSAYVEPTGDWGRGSVVLVELPSDKEINDNTVAFWQPEAPVKAGDELELSYRLLWGDLPQKADDMARVYSSRMGRAGNAAADDDPLMRKFVVEFEGGALASAKDIEPVLDVHGGKAELILIEPVADTGRLRITADIRRPSTDAVTELSLHLASEDKVLSETYAYQWGRS
ncbi:glucan biosynthesis protein [Pseudovibrio sp. SPO723]|uniref:glucan biosynthesis protein n=1 Tax=Nesiotobacter zosterae TaxID=392721 RepID=UPI0029C406C2|nr:glucan biosynthesis protein [Pseudovibrio sp. SPO723]MDX5594442.1 glucan biosynthesis protein [Pseudovibrio sp. SPO723]